MLIFHICARAGSAGPPFATDDPEPTTYRGWEIYLGLAYENSSGPVSQAPFAEFNYGALPNVQVSASIPLDDDTDSGIEFGIKTRFVQESASVPQISFYPSVVLPPNGRPGRVQTFLPVWAQKSSGRWTGFGGGGLYLDSTKGQRPYTFAGAALERELSAGTTVGAELYRQGAADLGERATTSAGVGAIFALGNAHAVLFSFGDAFSGSRSVRAYASYEIHTRPDTDR